MKITSPEELRQQLARHFEQQAVAAFNKLRRDRAVLQERTANKERVTKLLREDVARAQERFNTLSEVLDLLKTLEFHS